MAKNFRDIRRKADELAPDEREALERRLQAELDAEISEYEASLAELRRARELSRGDGRRAHDCGQLRRRDCRSACGG